MADFIWGFTKCVEGHEVQLYRACPYCGADWTEGCDGERQRKFSLQQAAQANIPDQRSVKRKPSSEQKN